MIYQSKLESLSISDLKVVAERAMYRQAKDGGSKWIYLVDAVNSLIDKRINELISDK